LHFKCLSAQEIAYRLGVEVSRENLEDNEFHKNKRVVYSGGNSSKHFSTYSKKN
jgi:hypothetical protein